MQVLVVKIYIIQQSHVSRDNICLCILRRDVTNKTKALLTYIDKMADDAATQPPTNGAAEHTVEDGDDAETQA